MNAGDIPRWVDGSDFNRSDPFTPLFDALARFYLTGDETVGEELDDPLRFAGGDGSVYHRVSAEEFEATDGN